MANPAGEFARGAPGIESAEAVRLGDVIHEYHGEVTDDPRTARILTLAPAQTDDAVETAFRQAAGQWQNPSTHPNIISVFDRGREPRPWIATAMPPGQPLDTLATDLAVPQVRTVIDDAAEAIRNAALYNTTHFDLRPGHVFIETTDGDVTAFVDDWGLGRACRVAAGQAHETPFTAPELLNDPDAGDERTDVYGLGAIAYYALTGQPPARPDSGTATLGENLTPPSSLTSAPGVTEEVDDVVFTALASAPADRYQSAYTFDTALGRALPTASDTTPGDESGQSSSKSTSSGEGSTPHDDTEEDVDFESASVAEAIAGHEPGDILTAREIQREAGKNEEWWTETAKPQLNASEHIEQADSTGQRWKVVAQTRQSSSEPTSSDDVNGVAFLSLGVAVVGGLLLLLYAGCWLAGPLPVLGSLPLPGVDCGGAAGSADDGGGGPADGYPVTYAYFYTANITGASWNETSANTTTLRLQGKLTNMTNVTNNNTNVTNGAELAMPGQNVTVRIASQTGGWTNETTVFTDGNVTVTFENVTREPVNAALIWENQNLTATASIDENGTLSNVESASKIFTETSEPGVAAVARGADLRYVGQTHERHRHTRIRIHAGRHDD